MKVEKWFDRLEETNLDTDHKTDGQKLSSALGLPNDIFDYTLNFNKTNLSDAKLVHNTLFPGLAGFFMEDMLGHILDEDNRTRIEKYFQKHVSANGTVPTLRIGKQPYGINVCSRLNSFEMNLEDEVLGNSGTTYSRDSITSEIEIPINITGTVPDGGTAPDFKEIDRSLVDDHRWQHRFDVRMKEMLKFFDVEWRRVAQENAKNVYLDNIQFHSDILSASLGEWSPQDHFMDIMGLHAHSLSLYSRYTINTGAFKDIQTTFGLLMESDFYENELPWNAGFNSEGFKKLRLYLTGMPINESDWVADTFGDPSHPLGIYTYHNIMRGENPSLGEADHLEVNSRNIEKSRAFRVTATSEAVQGFTDILHGNGSSLTEDSDEHYKSYIEYLTTANPNDIYADNQEASMSSISLFYSMLRASLMSKYRDITARIFVAEELSDWSSINNLGSSEEAVNSSMVLTDDSNQNFFDSETSYFSNQYVSSWKMTKWNLLFDKIKGRHLPYLYGSYLSPSSYSHNESELSRQSFWKWIGYNFDNYNLFNQNFFDNDTPTSGWYDLMKTMSDPYLTQNSLNHFSAVYDTQADDSPYAGDSSFFSDNLKNLYGDKQLSLYYLSNEKFDGNSLLQYLKPVNPNPPAGSNLGFFDTFYENNEDLATDKTMADYLFERPSSVSTLKHNVLLNELDQYLDSAQRLKNLSESDLKRGIQETIDITSFRLDAWINGLFSRRLDAIRSVESYTEGETIPEVNGNGNHVPVEGCYLGAYGYLENLTKDNSDDLSDVKVTPTPDQIPDEFSEFAGDLMINNSWDGYIITPSFSHGVTAAVLRSGYLSSKALEQPNVTNQLSIRLSSKRVRVALNLLDGMRNGQELGELLGYMLENALHERSIDMDGVELDSCIYALRKEFSFSDVEESITETVTDTGELRSGVVLNGEKLAEHIIEFAENDDSMGLNDTIFSKYSDNSIALITSLGISDCLGDPIVNDAAHRVLIFELDQLIDGFDALSDLLIAESFYQVAQGNMDRANAVTSMLSGGNAIVEPEIVKTPNTEFKFQNKVILNMEVVDDVNLGKATHWENITAGAIATAEPSLNKWIGNLLGKPELIVFELKHLHNEIWTSETKMTLSDLDLQPLDLLVLGGVNPVHSDSYLARKAIYQYKFENNLTSDIQVEVIFDTENTLDSETSFYNIIPFIDSIREVIANSKIIHAEDLEYSTPSDVTDLYGFDLTELLGRITIAKSKIETVLSDAQGDMTGVNLDDGYSLGDLSSKTPLELNNSLVEISSFGFPHALDSNINRVIDGSGNLIPDMVFDTELRSKMNDKLLSYCLILNDRLLRVENVLLLSSESNNSKTIWEHYKNCGTILFGGNFSWLPQVNVRNTTELQDATTTAALSDMFSATEMDESVNSWFHSLSRVRTNIQKLEAVQLFTSIYSKELSFTPAQIPYASGDFWLGGEFTSDVKMISRINLVLADKTLIANRMCGLVIDEWLEGIPTNKISGSVAFHMNQPGAEAPQNLLLAVPSKSDGSWTFDDLLYTVVETFDRAKYRTLEPEHIMKDPVLSKLFPSNTAEAFPTSYGDDESTENLDGIKPSFDYFKNFN